MIIHNPADVPVKDYPIQDPKTGEVFTWSINPGETLDFPDHVGKYLVEVYAFLQRVVTSEQLEQERKEQEALARGRNFSQVKIVDQAGGFTNQAMQPPAPELTPKNPVVTPPSQQPNNPPPPQNPEMVGAVVGDETDTVPTAVAQHKTSEAPDKSSNKGVVCPECKAQFQNKAAMKTHFAHTHLKIPGVD